MAINSFEYIFDHLFIIFASSYLVESYFEINYNAQ